MRRLKHRTRAPARSVAARAQLELYPPPHRFAVVTWGCAASRWLAQTLNAHPQIYCVHELNTEIASLAGTQRLDGHEYLELLGLQGSGYKAAGDVHGLSREGARAALDVLGDRVTCAVLVREPEARLLSQLALFRWAEQYPVWQIDYVDEIIRDKAIELPDSSYESRLVVHGANMLNAITEEVTLGSVYRMERVTTSPDRLGELVRELTGGLIDPTTEWCTTAIERPRSNEHRRSAGRSPLAPWQRNVVRKVVSEEAWTLYAQLGYGAPEWL